MFDYKHGTDFHQHLFTIMRISARFQENSKRRNIFLISEKLLFLPYWDWPSRVQCLARGNVQLTNHSSDHRQTSAALPPQGTHHTIGAKHNLHSPWITICFLWITSISMMCPSLFYEFCYLRNPSAFILAYLSTPTPINIVVKWHTQFNIFVNETRGFPCDKFLKWFDVTSRQTLT